ncbi:MAG: amino acid adenylation domain-containing protein [Nostoc sp. S4]|nr:amino acid adenylation domain-containing protein [Nostoc sp. S4]
MSDLVQQIVALSPEQRELLEKRLKQRGLSSLKTSEIYKRKDSNALPLSFSQQRLWFVQQLDPDNSNYNVFSALRLEGQLNAALLEQVFTEIVRRHENLRTTFISNSEGEPIQIIGLTQSLKLPIVDLRDIPITELEIQRLAKEEAQRSFDLTKPLLRFTLLQLRETEFVLFLTIHHIICDRWSLGIFVREMKELYEAFARGKSSPLPELPIQYGDWAAWQRQQLQGEVLETHVAYWKQQLANLPILELPTDRPRPPVATYQGARQPFVLSKSLSDALKALSAKEGVTLFTLLLAAFKVLLHRYTSQDDIVVGTDIANRNRVETEGLIGFIINTLVLRTNVTGNPAFRELLSRVREVMLGAYAHQDLPFEKLVEVLNPERNLSQMTPLFQAKFDFQLAQVETLELLDLTISPLTVDNETTKFELRFNLRETDRGLTVLVEYSTVLFDATTITRMLGHFQTLLEGIVTNPEQRLSDLPLLTQLERQTLLVEWNDTQTEYPSDQCIHQLFEVQVERTPDAVAVVFEDEQLTYRELNARANQLGQYLRKLGVKPEVLVGICTERSLEMIIGLLGILKAGGVYVPLDPTYPQERLSFILKDAQVAVLLTQQKFVSRLADNHAHAVYLDTDWSLISQETEINPISSVVSLNLAYVIYTSGSTGKPKGAMNTHQGICNRLLWMQEAYQINSTDSILQKTPFSFDVSVWEFFWTLITGARLVIAKPEGHRDSGYLINLIAVEQITTLHFVPSMLQIFIKSSGVEKCTSLKRVICSGEALPIDLQNIFFERLGCELHNLYGPTEAAIDVTFWQCQKNSNLKTVPIGRPIANTQIYILDAYLQPVPIGVTGEIYIGGVGVARGYLNHKELTNEKFIPNYFNNSKFKIHNPQFERLYKTGDLGRYLPDGNIQYVGRADYQVKIRGYRIEIGEIENVLSTHPQVREAVVITHSDRVAQKQLIAYITYSSEKPTLNNLRDFVKEKLPDFMIPAAFVMLETLPLTPNGKVDRKALPAPDTTRPELEAVYQPPQTEVEKTIANIWQEVLHLEDLGIHDNFFELGGHSLLLVQVHNKLQKIFELNFPLVEMFQYPTISHLAKYLSQESSQQKSFTQHSRRPESRTASVQQRKQARKEHRSATKNKGV